VSNSTTIEFFWILAQVVVGIKISSPTMAALISWQTLQTPHNFLKSHIDELFLSKII
jgi:hypothetical protein